MSVGARRGGEHAAEKGRERGRGKRIASPREGRTKGRRGTGRLGGVATLLGCGEGLDQLGARCKRVAVSVPMTPVSSSTLRLARRRVPSCGGRVRGSGHLHPGREVERGTATYALLGELASLLVLQNREEERSGLAQVERGSESGRTLELRINSMTRLSYGAKPTTCERLRISLRSPLLPRSSRTDLADDRLDERATLGLLALAVAGLVRLGEDSGRVTTVQAPGKVCERLVRLSQHAGLI